MVLVIASFVAWGCSGPCIRNSDCPGMLVCMAGECAMPIVEMDAEIPDGEPGDGFAMDAGTQDAEIDDASMDGAEDGAAEEDAAMDDAAMEDDAAVEADTAVEADASVDDVMDGGDDGASDAS